MSDIQIIFRFEILLKFHYSLVRWIGGRKILIFENFWGPQSNSHNSIISFEYVDSHAKIFLILYPLFENSTTCIAMVWTYSRSVTLNFLHLIDFYAALPEKWQQSKWQKISICKFRLFLRFDLEHFLPIKHFKLNLLFNPNVKTFSKSKSKRIHLCKWISLSYLNFI